MPRYSIPTRFNTDRTKAVVVTNIIGTQVLKFTAWEASTLQDCPHISISSLSSEGGRGWYGEVASRRLGAEFSKLPAGDARFTKVSEITAANHRAAQEILTELFPELTGFNAKDGECEVTVDMVRHLVTES